MKLNRAKALILVGTLSAVSCVVDDDDTDGDAGEAGEGSGGSSAGSAGSSAGTSAGKGGKGGSGGSGASGEAGAGGYAGADDCAGGAGTSCVPSGAGEGGMPGGGGAPSAGSAGEAGTPGAGGAYGGEGGEGGEAGGAPSCDEEALPSVSCEGLSEFSCAADGFISDSCVIPELTLKGYATDAVRSCMLGLTDAELCDDATNVYGCLRSGLEASCPDPSAATDCDAIVSYCDTGTVDAAECATYLSGMNSEGRYQMVACIQAGTTASCDLWSCVEGLTYPSVE